MLRRTEDGVRTFVMRHSSTAWTKHGGFKLSLGCAEMRQKLSVFSLMLLPNIIVGITLPRQSQCVLQGPGKIWWLGVPAPAFLGWVQPRRRYGIEGEARKGRRFRAAPFIPSPSVFPSFFFFFAVSMRRTMEVYNGEREERATAMRGRAPFFSAHFTDHSSF